MKPEQDTSAMAEQGVLPTDVEVTPLEHKVTPGENKPPDAIERHIVRTNHRNIRKEIADERFMGYPRNYISATEFNAMTQLGDPRIRHNEAGEISIRKYTGKKHKTSLPRRFPSKELGFRSIVVGEYDVPCYHDIEAAIRSTRKIEAKYDDKGEETLSLLGFHRTMRRIAKQMQLPPEVRPSMKETREYMLSELARYGYDNVRSSDNEEIVEMMLDAVKNDSLDRENPSRTRWILAQIYSRKTKMILGNKHKRNKYSYLGELLLGEREQQRAPFIRLSEEIKKMEQMDEGNKEAENLVRNTRLRAYSEISPTRIRVSPYVQLGAEIRYLLFGHNTQGDINILSRYLGPERARELAALHTYYELSPSERKERLSDVAKRIDQAMEKADRELDKDSEADFWDKVSSL